MWVVLVVGSSPSLGVGFARYLRSLPLRVDTPLAAGASCTLSDTQNRIWQVLKTPASLVVKKSDGPKTLICEKEGYHTTTTITGEEFVGARLGNVIHDGGVDILIDAA